MIPQPIARRQLPPLWLRVYDLLFGCRHRRITRAWTTGGVTYVVCWECAQRLEYDLDRMRIGYPIED